MADYEAAVTHRGVQEDVLHWHVLVADSYLIHFEFYIEDEMVTHASVARWTAFDSTNRLILASSLLSLQMHEADTIVLEVGGEPFIAVSPPSLDDEVLRQVQVHIETVAEIVMIESLSDEQ